jgi:hypothetical protein
MEVTNMALNKNPNGAFYSPFKGVTKIRKNYRTIVGYETTKDGKKKAKYGKFSNEITAALAYNEMAVEKYGLAARINTVPVPGLECVGNVEWELGSHYFTKEDLEPKE